MNERLNELRLDAGISQLQDDPRLVVIDRSGKVIDPLVGLEKFAELIVQECAELVASRPYIDDGNWSHPSMMIKKHFGVEE